MKERKGDPFEFHLSPVLLEKQTFKVPFVTQEVTSYKDPAFPV